MKDNIIIALIASLPGTLAAVASIINLIMHNKMKLQVDRIEVNTNSLTEALIKKTGQLEYRKGQEGQLPGFPERK